MLLWVRRAAIAGTTAIALAAATVATSAPANAQRFGGGFRGGGFHGGWHGGGWHGGGWRGGGWGWGPAIAGGLALGAVAAGPWGWGCGPVRRVVGFDPWGRPIVRWVDRCW